MPRQRLFCSVLALGLAVTGCRNHAGQTGNGAGAQTAPVRRPVIWDHARMIRVKAELAAGDRRHGPALARLRQQADRALGAGPFSVMNKKLTPPSGDKHDYMSVGPYWWPDPSKPDGLPYIRKDGERNPTRNSGDTDNAAETGMASAVETLGLAYFFTDHEPYAAHATRLLRTWFIDPATRMNPNLNFSQAIPGVSAGRPTGVIDTVDLVNMLDAIELLGPSAAFTKEDDRDLRAWFGRFLDWLLDSEIGRGERRASNNHGSWYDVQVSRFALFAGREAVARTVVAEARESRIARQIEADGQQPRELERTRSFNYSVYNLQALYALGAIAANLGVDLYRFETADGRGLRRALEFLLPYLDPAVSWPHRQIGGRDGGGLISILRRARQAFGDPRYDELLGRFFATQLPEHRSQLVLP